MAHTKTDTLSSLLRGELSAVETYEQALKKLADTQGAAELVRIRSNHVDAVAILRRHLQQHGGEDVRSSGVWGVFARAVEGAAKVLGPAAAIKALLEGEEHGIKGYEEALEDGELPTDCEAIITSTMLPRARDHVQALKRQIAGMVERIPPEEARRRMKSSAPALLVCAYDDEAKCRQNHIEGAIALKELQAREKTLPKTQELIFYCA